MTMTDVLPTARNIEEAHTRLREWVISTPVLESDVLNSRAGSRVLIKAESLQHTGTFKIRGALNRLLQLSHEERSAGVVAFSSGNHAQGVAMASKWLGVEATIVMPKDAPKIKQFNTRVLGAKIILYDRYLEDREYIAAKIAQKTGAALVPAFDHPDIIAGQGTVGLETARHAYDEGLELNAFYCPCGGGGLVAGCALSINSVFEKCEIYAVEPESYDDTRRSLESGERQMVCGHPVTICDALMAPMPGAITFAINREALAGGLTVTDTQTTHAVAFAARHLKLVLEPAGAVALAAVLGGVAQDLSCVAIILSGANIDHEQFLQILDDYPDP
uniref:Putative threonine dehydratase (IlvA, tdcB) n=1 Tax=uncultured marine thaumarchaeote KM3_54_G03 TaxID=1456192 RepID=A0A075HE23_9ARCH|nr:putative threonine dehydratase (ilvA, tdcB) [uncultured marine thaumarchaeote KM3_54_G03]